ncbi:hypothetical protein N7486_005338 [Penicillium sp. IBT 16267x]|nr:hypothetical protein N7486_005338 [Penicillium sp. IBT 16267x]
MCEWRTRRRCWELQLIVDEWQFGSMECLPLAFSLDDIVDAKIAVLTQNDDDASKPTKEEKKARMQWFADIPSVDKKEEKQETEGAKD